MQRATYAEFEEEIVIGKSDDFASDTWEDVESVTKFELAEKAIVMCHRCWLERHIEFSRFLSKKISAWTEEPAMYALSIKKAIQTVNYYRFDDTVLKTNIKLIRNALLEAVKGDK